MAGLSLKGPARLGASELDEGALTVAVVGAYDAEDGKAGLIAAGRVLPARRELWRLVETYAPGALADALRARSSTADQTGRGGVRELRRALADWLAPWPRCHRCARPIEPDTSLVACPGAVQRVWVGKGRHPAPTLCTPHRGRPTLRGARLHRPVGRDGSLALFSPVHLDPIAAEAKSALRHGASCAYDVVVDRDGRILLGLTDPNPRGGSTPPTEAARHPLIAAARREWDRRIDVALRANGRLILKTQLRYFSPKGSVTRADLVQGGAMGCRRALMDFDASMGNKFSTYAVNWIYQGMGEVFGDRDVVHAPDWATSLHHKIEEMGIAPALVLSYLGAVAETRNRPTDCQAAATEFVDLILPALLAVNPDLDIPGAITEATRAAMNPPKAKTDTGDERSRERVATWAVRLLGFESATGGGLLTALRFGAATVVSTVGTGERDDSSGSGGGGDSDDGAGHAHRSPEHLRNNPDDNDAEAQAIEEDEARKQWAILLSGLQSLLTVDPEAAEVVRRRHALDGLGDPETLDEIAAAPLRCTARALCRESIRKAYTRGIASLKRAAAGETLARHDGEMKDEYEYDFAGTYRRRPHGPFKPMRPANVSAMVAAPRETPHAAEDFGEWGGALMVL
jgi:hypothetical protein